MARIDDWRDVDGKPTHYVRIFALSQEFPPGRACKSSARTGPSKTSVIECWSAFRRSGYRFAVRKALWMLSFTRIFLEIAKIMVQKTFRYFVG